MKYIVVSGTAGETTKVHGLVIKMDLLLTRTRQCIIEQSKKTNTKLKIKKQFGL